MVMDWHGKKGNIDMVITAQDPGDEHAPHGSEMEKPKSMISSIGYRGEEWPVIYVVWYHYIDISIMEV